MKTVKRILIKLTIYILLFCIALVGCDFLLRPERLAALMTLPEPIIQTVEVTPPRKPLKQLLEEIPPRYSISPILAAAIVEKESNGQNVARFEPGQVERARKAAGKGASEAMVRMYSSSHCYMQVMGYHAPRFNLQPGDLYNAENCVEVASAILKECYDRTSANDSKYKRWHSALACYNGSSIYADEIIDRLSELLIEHIL